MVFSKSLLLGPGNVSHTVMIFLVQRINIKCYKKREVFQDIIKGKTAAGLHLCASRVERDGRLQWHISSEELQVITGP